MKAAMFVWTLVIVGAMTACSSSPRTASKTEELRSDYIASAEKSLDKWQDKIGKLRSDRQSTPRAMVLDARAELQTLKDAPDSSWTRYRPRVDDRISQVESTYRRAHAE